MNDRDESAWFFRGHDSPLWGILLGIALFMAGHLLTVLIFALIGTVLWPMLILLAIPGVTQMIWVAPLVLFGNFSRTCDQALLTLAGVLFLLNASCWSLWYFDPPTQL